MLNRVLVKHKLSNRFIFYIILFSSFVTIFSTGFQLYFDYRHDLGELKKVEGEIKKSHKRGLEKSFWQLDHEQIRLDLEGVTGNPYISYAEIIGNNGKVFMHSGNKEISSYSTRKISLVYPFNDNNIFLGQLKITISRDIIFSRLLDRLFIILITNTLKTIPVILFLYFLFHSQISRHLKALTTYARDFDILNSDYHLTLERDSFIDSNNDELTAAVRAINEMWKKLHHSYDEIAKSKESYRTLIESADEEIFVSDLNLNFSIINASHYFNMGYDKVPENPVNPFARVHPNDVLVIDSWLKQVRESGKGKAEYRVKNLSGNTLYKSGSAVLIKRGNDSNSEIFFIIRDITEHHKISSQLSEVNERLNIFIDNTPDLVCFKDGEGKWLMANNKILDLYGLDKHNYVGNSESELAGKVHPLLKGYFSQFKILDREIWKSNKSKRYEQSVPQLDADNKIYDVIKTPLYSPDGSPKGMVMIGRDITDIKKNKRKIATLSTALEQSPVSVIITNSGGTIEYVNNKFLDFSGFEETEILGNHFTVSKLNIIPLKYYADLTEKLAKNDVWSATICCKNKKGHLTWKNTSISPIFNNENILTNYLILREDVTELKKQSEELIKAKEAAESANRIKSNFLANMSHETRTPLNAINGMVSLLKDSDITEEQEEFIDIIQTSSDGMLNLIDDILNLTMLESGKLKIRNEYFNLGKEMLSLIESFKILANEKKIELNLHFQKGINQDLEGDIILLRKLLVNIINNAIKFTPAGSVSLSIQALKADSVNTKLLFKVSDTGIGIPKNKKKHIFDSFTQADSSSTRRYGGTGLGLSTSKALVELMGGKIWVDSEVNNGSHFYISLPFSLPNVRKGKEIKDLIINSNGCSGLRILLTEHRPAELEELSKELKEQGNYVELLENGAEALELLTKKQFDILLINDNLPGLDGFEITKMIKGEDSPVLNPEIPVFAMINELGNRTPDKFIESGFHAFIEKPFSFNQLSKLLIKHL